MFAKKFKIQYYYPMSQQQQIKQHCFYTLQRDNLNSLANKVISTLHSVDFDRLACIDLLPLALTSIVSIGLDKPFIILRKQTKGYGTNNAIEGNVKSGDRLAVISFDFDTATQSMIQQLQNNSYLIQSVTLFKEGSVPSHLPFKINYID